jgi:hypothetical protein
VKMNSIGTVLKLVPIAIIAVGTAFIVERLERVDAPIRKETPQRIAEDKQNLTDQHVNEQAEQVYPNLNVVQVSLENSPEMAVWQQKWRSNIIAEARNRYCDREMGEEIGWLVSPFLNGFYYGYLATSETQWIDRLVDWTDSWIRRGVMEPDGYIGWPKVGAAGTDVDQLNSYYADSMLGEAMALRPIVLMSGLILKDPSLKAKYGDKAESYLKLARSNFDKWEKRGAWRPAGAGMVSVVLPFGLDVKTGGWTSSYPERNLAGNGFSHQDNKANLVAQWLLAMSDVTGDGAYREKADDWFKLMKSRISVESDGTFKIWNYWEPAGPWDYRPDGTPKHWIGVHPNAGYYEIDVNAIVSAFEHGSVFTDEDIRRLTKTALVSGRYWFALAPYDQGVRSKFEQSLKPDGWDGLVAVPWYLSLHAHGAD